MLIIAFKNVMLLTCTYKNMVIVRLGATKLKDLSANYITIQQYMTIREGRG